MTKLTKRAIKTVLNLGPDVLQVTKNNSLDPEGSRVYRLLLDGATYDMPSVTSIVGSTLRAFPLEMWKHGWIKRGLESQIGKVLTRESMDTILDGPKRELKRSAEIGTTLHGHIEDLIGGKAVVVSDQLKPAVSAWQDMNKTVLKDWHPVGVEQAVWCVTPQSGKVPEFSIPIATKSGFAGTIDALYQKGTKLMIFDWKTSRSVQESHMIQLAGYKLGLQMMLESEYMSANPDAEVIDTDGIIPRRQPLTVSAVCARFVNDYPTDDRHRPIRTEEKIFEEDMEITFVDPVWEEAFLYCVFLYSIRNYMKEVKWNAVQ